MVRATKIRTNKYKSEYIIKLVGIYIHQKCILTREFIGTKMGNINGEIFRINYINVNHLVRLYDMSIPFTVLKGVAIENFLLSLSGKCDVIAQWRDMLSCISLLRELSRGIHSGESPTERDA